MKRFTVLLLIFVFPFLGISQERDSLVQIATQTRVSSTFGHSDLKPISLDKAADASGFGKASSRRSPVKFGFTGKEINKWTSPEYNHFKFLKDYRTREMVDFTNPNKNYMGGDYIQTNATNCSRYWLVRYDVTIFNATDFSIGF